MFQELSEKAKALTDKVNLKQAVDQLKQSTLEQMSLTQQHSSELSEKIKALTEKVDFKQTVDQFKHTTVEQVSATKQQTNDFLEHNWPKIESTMMDGLLNLTEENLKDEKILAALFNKMYEFLPLTIRLFLPRTLFLSFAIQKREPLLLKLQDYKAKREHPDTPPEN